MNPKQLALILPIIALSISSLSSLFAQEKKPNIIFILMDDMGYSDVSCYGAKKVNTPNIDKMAEGGMKFTDFHAAASICSPSRAAFLTGAYPQRCGLYMGINPKRQAHWFLGLNPDEITIAEQAKSQGYTTSIIGKWHLGSQEPFSYYHQGFDHYYGASENMGHSEVFRDEKEIIYQDTPLEKLNTLYTKRLVKQINDFKDEPFFIYYAHNYPHTPFRAGPKFQGSSQDGARGDVIQECDWSIGEMLKALEENNLLENTLVIFTSDNGPLKQEYAAPYSGTKYVSKEGGHRVPFILYWKGTIPATGDVSTPAIAMDLFPTLTQIMGAEMPADREYDGVSLTPLWNGAEIARDPQQPFYFYNCENLQAVRVGDWKLHLPRERKQVPFWEQPARKFKPVTQPELYNINDEKAEKVNRAADFPEKVAEMTALAESTRERLGEYMQRGSEQRPTGTLFPEVPIVSNQQQDWSKLSAAEKGRALTEFESATPKKREKPKKQN